MAKMNEEMVVLKVSELLRDDVDETGLLDEEMLEALQAVIQDLVGDDKLVEIIKE